MKKETLTLEAIKKDFKVILNVQYSSNTERWLVALFYLAVIAISIGAIQKDPVLGVLIFAIGGAYPLYRYVTQTKEALRQKSALLHACERGELSISVKKFSHMAEETVYRHSAHGNDYAYIKVYYFEDGSSWRAYLISMHYCWSKEFHLSKRGLENLAAQGSEFYYICLQQHPEIAYIYPCLMFRLDEELEKPFP